MRQRQGRSLTEDVYAELRQAVLHGQIAPGTRLHLGELAEANEVSLGVVREAVTRLASEGLLEATPQTGFRTRNLSQEHLSDLTWARCEIEALTVRESVTYGDTEWEASLLAAHHVLSVTPPHVDDAIHPAWMVAHRRFHTMLAAGCPNTTLVGIRQRLFDEAELYRHWSARGPGSQRNIGAEHAEMLASALSRDAERCAELVQEHLRNTARLVVESSGVVGSSRPRKAARSG
jgi:GntR family transcriptional regulator, carbon starvation induced regulator